MSNMADAESNVLNVLEEAAAEISEETEQEEKVETELKIQQVYTSVWSGRLKIKCCRASVRMYHVSGSLQVAWAVLPLTPKEVPPLKILQRIRLVECGKAVVRETLKRKDKHCILLAVPCGINDDDLEEQTQNMKEGFISYFKNNNAAGVVCAAPPGKSVPTNTCYFFSSCEFSDEILSGVPGEALAIARRNQPLLIVVAAEITE